MAFLVVEKGNASDLGKMFPLGTTTVIIGRKAIDPSADIVLNDGFISRRHAEIVYKDGSYMIRDLGSTNGTTLDGKMVNDMKHNLLKPDSVIGLGINDQTTRIILIFKDTDATITFTKDELSEVNNVTWLQIDKARKEAIVDGKHVSLPPRCYKLLCYLYENAGKVCSMDEIIANVWQESSAEGVSDAAIIQLIHRLRDAVEVDPLKPRRLISKKGFGYALLY